MIGITAYGGYVPRLRLAVQAVAQANAWYTPQFARRQGNVAFGNWDEDSITMAVAAARTCLGPSDDRSGVRGVLLASNTLPFAERLNSAVVAGALTLDDDIQALDVGGSQRCALSALSNAAAMAQAGQGNILVIAAESRRARPGSTQELEYGDAAAAVLMGVDNVLAEYLGGGSITADFIDHFRATDRAFDYHWEERWVRDEGISKLVPPAIQRALTKAGIGPEAVDYFIFPTMFKRLDQFVAKASGVSPDAVVDNLSADVGLAGAAHGLLMLAHVLERAEPGQVIVVAEFGSGAQAAVFRATAAIRSFKPARSVQQWVQRGVEEHSYTRFLSFKGHLGLERGMRGEQDKKTALSTAWRHHQALLGLVGGRCEVTGSVHFPPSRLTYDNPPRQDTQRPYKLAERRGKVLSWSAEYLSWHPSPPHHYGQIDFDEGGRLLMDFTDLDVGEVETGQPMEMVFRIKDIDELRGFRRYFWKATPVRD